MKIDIATSEQVEEVKSLLIEVRDLLLNKSQHDAPAGNWLKSAQVRKLLGCSSGTLLNLRANGTLTARKIGGTLYYSKSTIDKILSSKNKN